MGLVVAFGWVVVVKDKAVVDGFYRSKWGAERRRDAERANGLDARIAEAWFSTGTTE